MADEGILILTDAEGWATNLEVRVCPHCGLPFAMIKGSGRIRGTCPKCPGRVTCGGVECFEHSEIMRRIEGVEEGKIPISAL